MWKILLILVFLFICISPALYISMYVQGNINARLIKKQTGEDFNWFEASLVDVRVYVDGE